MAWIEVHQDLRWHPKRVALSAALGMGSMETLGLLVAFWLWCLEHRENGLLEEHASQVISEGLGVENGEEILEAMVKTGWLDRVKGGGLAIHDWRDYAGRLMDQREKNRVRKRAQRDRERDAAGQNQPVTGTSRGRHGATLPNPTEPKAPQPPAGGSVEGQSAARFEQLVAGVTGLAEKNSTAFAKPNPKGAGLLSAWAGAWKDPRRRELIDTPGKINHLVRSMRAATWAYGQTWLRTLEFVLSRKMEDRTTWKIAHLCGGGYQDDPGGAGGGSGHAPGNPHSAPVKRKPYDPNCKHGCIEGLWQGRLPCECTKVEASS